MPDAQKRGSSSAPGISLRNSGANSPCTVEQCTPTFSNTRPCIIAIDAAAAGTAGMVGALPGRADKPARRHVRLRSTGRQLVFQLFEGGADLIAQRLEPCPCGCLAPFEFGRIGQGKLNSRRSLRC